MILKFKITPLGYNVVCILFDGNTVIFDSDEFDTDVQRDYNLKLFFGELIAFNYEGYIRYSIDKKTDFRQAEARDILLKGNKWFMDNNHLLDKVLDALEKIKDLLRDCVVDFEHSVKHEMFVKGIRQINEWAEYVDNK